LVASKGLDILYEALAPILVDRNIFLLYVGSIDKSEACGGKVMEKIASKAMEQRLTSRVVFLGHQNDVVPILGAANVLAHPVGREAFGLVLVEAMAVGIQVVASNVEGIPEVLAGTDSVMVDPNDPLELRDALLSVLDRTSDQAIQAITRGKTRAEDFRAENRTDAMVRLFEDALSGRF
jgi:glycosyltransferase involved in cell wall biosynthesis